MKGKERDLAKSIVWDLSKLYKDIADPNINKDKQKIRTDAKTLEKQYRGKIKNGKILPSDLAIAIKQYESILTRLAVYTTFAGLLQAKDTTSDKINHFYQHSEEFSNEISNLLIFLELEILEIPEPMLDKYLTNKELAQYQQFLKRTIRFREHTLPEEHEVLINKKTQTGSSAFIRLYDQISTDLVFPLKIGTTTHNYNYSEITNILSSHKDRSIREKASKSITKVYTQNSRTFSFIINTLLLDKKVSDEIRKYHYPQERTFLGDEIEQQIVTAMTNTIEKNYKICHKYYNTKSKILNTKLYEWDRYSEIYPNLGEPHFTYEQAKALILEAFREFSPLFADIAEKFFDNNWIDAEISKGKRSGAFCAYCVPSRNPYILTNYMGKANDVRTLAHELGHGIHAYLSSKQSLLNYYPVTPLAEISSIFCENLVFRKIYDQTKDIKQKTNLLGGRLQEIFATIFRQNAFYLFESDIHKKRRDTGELSVTELNKLFQTRVQTMFGSALKLTEGHQYWWIPISHFYHYNFYVFSYAFGQSLSNALYSAYLNDGEKFVSNYIKVLGMGSSKELIELTKILGVEINKTAFWEEGLKPISELVDEFERLGYSFLDN